MKRSKKQGPRPEAQGAKHEPEKKPTLTRREFVQYSTFALVAASFAAPLSGCGGSGGDGDGEDTPSEDQLTLNPNQVSPGSLLEISCTDAPTANTLPEDIYSVMVEVDGEVSYGLRPLYFGEDRVVLPTPPMVEDAGGTYFDARNVRVRLSVGGIEKGQAFLAVLQDEPTAGNGADLLALLNDTLAELAELNTDKDTLFEDADLLTLWEQMYAPTVDGVDRLVTTLETLYSDQVAEVAVIDGSRYQLLPDDMNLAERLLDHLNADLPDGLSSPFFDAFSSTAAEVIKGLAALLAYALSGAYLVMSRDRADRTACSGTVAVLATALAPAACMCVAGNCMRLLTNQQAEPEWVARGVNWFANFLMNLGHYALNDSLICTTSENNEGLRLLVTQDSIDLLEVLSGSLYDDTQWSNSTPWSNGAPWSNAAPWSNTVWTNQPWSHLPWNNTAPWSHNPWSNNIWNNTTPWSNNTWTNTTPWSDNAWTNAPWSNTPWSNTPWGNTPWSNTPWSNWSNTPWSNAWTNNWNNFVNSGA